MEFKAKDIAALLQGTVEGDGELVVSNVSKIEEGKPGTLAFLANPKYEHYIYTTKASVVLVNRDFKPSQPVGCTLVRVASAYDAIAALLRMYEEMVKPKHAGIEQPSGGKLYMEGQEVTFKNTSAARAKGIGIIHQELSLFPNLTIAQNIYMNHEKKKGLFVDNAAHIEGTKKVLERLQHQMP